MLENRELLSASEYEVAVYQTPEGKLCEVKDENVKLSAPPPASAAAKEEPKKGAAAQKGGKGAGGVKGGSSAGAPKDKALMTKEELEWAKLKEEQERKKLGVDPAVAAKLTEQSAIRARFKALAAPVETALTVLTELSRRAPTVTRKHVIAAVLPYFYSLFRNGIIRGAANRAHSSLFRSLDPLLIHACGQALPRSIQIVVRFGARTFDNVNNCELIRKTMLTLAKAIGPSYNKKNLPLSAPAFLFILPLLSSVIQQSQDKAPDAKRKDEEEEHEQEEDSKKPLTRSRSDEDIGDGGADDTDFDMGGLGLIGGIRSAVSVLSFHGRPDLNVGSTSVRFPSSELVSLLLHVIGSVANLRGNVEQALKQLAPSLKMDEISHLLGNAGLLSPHAHVRAAAVAALANVRDLRNPSSQSSPIFPTLRAHVFTAAHDVDPDVQRAANALWNELHLSIDSNYLPPLLDLISHENEAIRQAAGSSIADGVRQFPETVSSTLEALIDLFVKSPDKELGARPGLRGPKEFIWRWPTRSGVALCIAAMTDSLGRKAQLQTTFHFLLSNALADLNDKVWDNALRAGLTMIDAHGADNISTLLPLFENTVKSTMAGGKGEEEEIISDKIREGVVVFMGTIAKHMPPDSPKLLDIVNNLLQVLKTPSHSVQRSVSECLSPLASMSIVQEDAGRIIDVLFDQLANGEEYADRKGAAFGLAGLIKGLKLAALKKYNILERLEVLVKDKNNPHMRQGALFAYDRLFNELGSRFEPYVVRILDDLLTCAGDGSVEVREATDDAAKVIMSHLTGHGVKMVLPIVLSKLDDKQWRTKFNAIQLLGAMSNLAPQQLSQALPMIVPRLLEVMSDAHEKVQSQAKSALKSIALVIKNPEILSLSSHLLAALNDPSQHTKKALHELMRTSFIHSVDPASLALIVPILRRGLRSPSAPVKRMAAQIVGSICSLISDVKDILPYASTLLKYLKLILLDPIPEVRAVAAKALAMLYKGIGEEGEEGFDTIQEWLLTTLNGDTSSVQRSGAAQGLAQLLHVLGHDKTKALLPVLFEGTESERAVVREGFYNLFGFLPEAFGMDFHEFVGDVLPVVIHGLADEIAPVREAALAAGQALILNFAATHTNLLLPALETGLIAEDWRIRLSSVQLLGVMLLKLAGVNPKLLLGNYNQLNEEDDMKEALMIANREQEELIERVLGLPRRNQLFATVYLMRSDVVPAVNQIAWRVWKAIVSNTPRMLSTILPTLMNSVIFDLASSNEERQAAAGTALGELVQKMGENILPQIMPILQSRLKSDDNSARQGVCLGLSEIMLSARRGDLAAYMPDLVAAIRDALCDIDSSVRQAAGRALMTLYKTVGKRAVDDIVPSLIAQLDEAADDQDKSELVFEGMRTVLTICHTEALPLLLPQLLVTPFTPFHARALGQLSDVFGKGFYRYVPQVTSALIQGMSSQDTEIAAQIAEAGEQVVVNVNQESVHALIDTLVQTMDDIKSSTLVKAACARLMASFCAHTECRIDSFVPMLLQALLKLYADPDESLAQAGWDGLEALLKNFQEEDQVKHIAFVRSVINDLTDENRGGTKMSLLPGLCLKKGMQPLLPMFLHGLVHGISPQMRVDAADGLGDLISLTSPAALSPFVVKITGPLIRIVGDRFPGEVKAAILRTLGLLIGKAGVVLKPFVPQLQTTFIKALQDPAAAVRDRGAIALADLMAESKRVEPVLTELSTHIRTGDNMVIKASMLNAMYGILSNKEVGPKLSVEILQKTMAVALQVHDVDKDSVRIAAGQVVGVIGGYLPDKELESLVIDVLSANVSLWKAKDGYLQALIFLVKNAGKRLSEALRQKVHDYAISSLNEDNVAVLTSGIQLTGELLQLCASLNLTPEAVKLAQAISPLVADPVASTRHDACVAIQGFAEVSGTDVYLQTLDVFVPALLARSTDANGPVRRASMNALYFLLQFQHGEEKADLVVSKFAARLNKKDSIMSTALVTYVKRSIVGMKATSVKEAESGATTDETAAPSDASNADDE